MGDGMSDGYRAARRQEERQRKVDDFFAAVAAFARGEKPDEAAFRAAFDGFEEVRHERNIARGRIAAERERRWKDLRAGADRAAEARDPLADPAARLSWAWALALAMLHASPQAVESLKDASPFRAYSIAVFAPNGTTHDGYGAPPTIVGDLGRTLDLLAAGAPSVCVRLYDADRAIVGLRGSGKDAEEVLERERGKLRFIAVLDRTSA